MEIILITAVTIFAVTLKNPGQETLVTILQKILTLRMTMEAMTIVPCRIEKT